MKSLIATFLVLISTPILAKIVFGPVSLQSHCPGSGRGQTSGKVQYCIFDDPRVVQVIHGKCPPGIPGALSTSNSKEEWCVIKK